MQGQCWPTEGFTVQLSATVQQDQCTDTAVATTQVQVEPVVPTLTFNGPDTVTVCPTQSALDITYGVSMSPTSVQLASVQANTDTAVQCTTPLGVEGGCGGRFLVTSMAYTYVSSRCRALCDVHYYAEV